MMGLPRTAGRKLVGTSVLLFVLGLAFAAFAWRPVSFTGTWRDGNGSVIASLREHGGAVSGNLRLLSRAGEVYAFTLTGTRAGPAATLTAKYRQGEGSLYLRVIDRNRLEFWWGGQRPDTMTRMTR